MRLLLVARCASALTAVHCMLLHAAAGRLLLEVMEAVAAAIGPERVGLRLSPYNTFLDAKDTVERAIEKNVWLMKELDSRVPGLAYVHMVRQQAICAGTSADGCGTAKAFNGLQHCGC